MKHTNTKQLKSALESLIEGAEIDSVITDLSTNKSSVSSYLTCSEYLEFTPKYAYISQRGSIPYDESPLRTYFDEFGKLRFSKLEGILIQNEDYTDLMHELTIYAECAHADSGIVELMDGYEGTLQDLKTKLTSMYSLIPQVTI